MQNILFLIIDMQKGFINNFTAPLIEDIRDFQKKISQYCVTAGTRYVNHEHTACYVFEGWTSCMKGTEEAEIVPELGDCMAKIFDKDKYSCWNEELQSFVHDNGINKIYFAGVNTGCCVLNSVLDCYNDLVDCAVIEDLCGSTSGREEHEAAVTVLKSCITEERVITAEQAYREICERKNVSLKRIKDLISLSRTQSNRDPHFGQFIV